MTIPISYYLILSAIVFLTGVVGVLIRRNIIAILLSVELMLNATNINFVAFSDHLQDLGGQVFRLFCFNGGRCGGCRRTRDYHRSAPIEIHDQC